MFHFLQSQEGRESELKELIPEDLPTSASSVQVKDKKESDTTSSQSNYTQLEYICVENAP